MNPSSQELFNCTTKNYLSRQNNDFSRLWSILTEAGSNNKAFFKASNGKLNVTSTSWVWNLHAVAHDFDIQRENAMIGLRKVFSSNLAHISIVFFWLNGMHFHGAYFSNYIAWIKCPKHYLSSAQLTCSSIGQDILNSDVGNCFQGIHMTSGVFNLWRSKGILGNFHLKYAMAL